MSSSLAGHGAGPAETGPAATSSTARPVPRRVMVIYGTRQEAVMAAPLIRALTESPLFAPIVAVAAGRQRARLDEVNATFGITPEFDLDLGRPGQTPTDDAAQTVRGVRELLTAQHPDAVVVPGDSPTTFAVALAAHHEKVPLVRLAPGPLTADARAPYPREINRRLANRLTALHLAPTAACKAGLLAGNADPARVVVIGSTSIDATRWAAPRQVGYGDPALADLDEAGEPVLLVTPHRLTTRGASMQAVVRALTRIARRMPGLRIVCSLPAGPLGRREMLAALGHLPNVTVTGPLAFGAFARLMDRARLILTDSDEVQEAGQSLGTPVLLMRGTTQRPEAIRAGAVRLVGTDEELIANTVGQLLIDRSSYDAMAGVISPYGDGKAAKRAVAAIAHHFGLGPAPTEFGAPADQDALARRPGHAAARSARRGGTGEELRELLPSRSGRRSAPGHRPGGRGVRVPYSRHGCLSTG